MAHVIAPSAAPAALPPLDLTTLLSGRRFVVIGGTGFLGKVWWASLLHYYPVVDHLFLLVRPKQGKTAEERFEAEVVKSDVLRPIREHHGDAFEAFIRSKVTPVAGDVVQPYCGLDAALRNTLRGDCHGVLNVSGVVDFDPPLDRALEVNAFGCQNLVDLARDLGDTPLLHTSTCFVAGSRTGQVEELNPLDVRFPKSRELDPKHWEPQREIAECLDVIEQARHRASDAFRQSRFLDEAKKNLEERREPATGKVLEEEIARVKRRFVEKQLSDMGMERAQFWGFPNTYTYTKSIGEQIIAASGLPFTIGRPAVVESTVSFPFEGWNEGINTSAPLIYSLREGQVQFPGSDNSLDVIPCDMVAAGLTLSLAELLEGTAKPVYQYGSSDSNPCSTKRFLELAGIYKRKYYQRTKRGGPVVSAVASQVEGAVLSKEAFERFGPKTLWQTTKTASGWLKSMAVGPAAPFLKPASKALFEFSETQRRMYRILSQFAPFTAEFDYVFRCDNTRAAYARLTPGDQARVRWAPETIDWRQWFLEVHVPGLEKWVFPEIDKRIRRPKVAPRAHYTLPSMLLEMADRYGLSIALQRTEEYGLSRLSFEDWRDDALAAAQRLAEAGVARGDRVLLCGANHPAWAVTLFGIHFAGATAVPLDANIDGEIAGNLLAASGAKALVADAKARARIAGAVDGKVPVLDLQDTALPGPKAEPATVEEDDLALLLYTSGTTGKPKGVMLSHGNVTALVASLAPLFPLTRGDRLLSVLPLHHTFEMTCGLLLPLSRGARVIYLDELNGERLEHGLKEGRVTAMIGVPALWEMIERRVSAKVAERGQVARIVFDTMLEFNRSVAKNVGVDLGPLLFGPVHEGLGGHLRVLVSGSAALPERVHQRFAGFGLHLAEGYGLTEAAPVLTVAKAGPRTKHGHVGRPVPNVDVRIDNPNDEGVGEIVARGPNVMKGYEGDADATAATFTDDGWLKTGDLGKFDGRGNLIIVGRAKDTIVASSGENVYPEDVEGRLGKVAHIKEYTVLGVADPKGGERVALVAVVEAEPGLDKAARHTRAKKELDLAIARLPRFMRPAITTLLDVDLPRTTTRKVKRGEVRRLVDKANEAQAPDSGVQRELADLDDAARIVRSSAAAIARRSISEVTEALSLRGDLGFDSLMLLELLVAVEAQAGVSVDGDALAGCDTIGDAERVLREVGSRRRSATTSIERVDGPRFEVPKPMLDAARSWLGRAQDGLFTSVFNTRVEGRSNIPYNRNTLVIANHASHLDMALVQAALGSYGEGMVTLAAKDYFFEGNKWRSAYFEHLTHVEPLDRRAPLNETLAKIEGLLDAGKTVLIFPEGTRSPDGLIHEFKPVVGHVALQRDVDILPLHLDGTHAALPKGASTVRSRNLAARIGPALTSADLRRLSEGMAPMEAARLVTRLAEKAVRELERGKQLNLSRLKIDDVRDAPMSEPPPPSMAALFEELESRFDASAVKEPVSYYFSLDSERWTMTISPDSLQVTPGKATAPADCVLKTSPAMFIRIVRDAYTPTPAEFLSGAVKSNNIPLLLTFQKVFRLDRSAEKRAEHERVEIEKD